MTLDELQAWMASYNGLKLSVSPCPEGWSVVLIQGKRVSDARAGKLEEAVELAKLKHESTWKMAK